MNWEEPLPEAAVVMTLPSWKMMPREPEVVDRRMSPSTTCSFESGLAVPTPMSPPTTLAEPATCRRVAGFVVPTPRLPEALSSMFPEPSTCSLPAGLAVPMPTLPPLTASVEAPTLKALPSTAAVPVTRA